MPTNDQTARSLLVDLVREFEELQESGQRASIHEFVPRVPPELRPELFERLLTAELDFQSRSGKTFAVRDYRQQFPEYREIIDTVLQRLSTPQGNADGAGSDATLDDARNPQATLREHRQQPPEAPGVPDEKLLPPKLRGGAPAAQGRIGDYEILEEIARGGMGVVYKARQLKLNRVVALKMILAGQFASQDEVLRFYSEAEAAARLDHPGIVPIYEVDEFEGKHYFSMGFVDGESLQQRVARGPLRRADAAEIVKQVADAVHYAHLHGIVHRDLKPRNILMTTDGKPRVTDFGLAKSIEEDGGLTVSGQILGTPGYMPPEQAHGKLDSIGPQSDVYALGAVLYCLLTGRPPFQSATVMETIKQVLETPPASPRALNPAIDRDLETICLKCLEKQPDHRYPSAADLGEELRRYLAGEPIKARPVGPVARTARWLKRRPLVVALGSLLLLALLTPATIVVGMRTAEARRLAALQHQIDTELDAPQLTADWLTQVDTLLQEVKAINPDLAASEQVRMHKSFGQKIAEEQARPRLDEELVVRLKGAIDLLQQRDKPQAGALRTELDKRLQEWQALFTLAPPFDNAGEIFATGEFQLQKDRLLPQVAEKVEVRRSLTRLASGGSVELEAHFDQTWEGTSRIGVSLRADAQRGYDFVLLSDDARTIGDDLPGTAGDQPQELTFRKLRQREAYFTLAIFRNGLPLIREQVSAAEIPAGPVVIRASCEQAELRLQVGPLRPVKFRDPFPLSSRQAGVFAVQWPRDVGLLNLVGRTKPKSSAASPLEQGDELFELGDFAQALEHYQQQALQTEDAEFRQESRYKQALCHLQLNRHDAAATLLEAVMNGEGERWPPIAGCQLWLLRLQQKRHAEADFVFDNLSSRFRFDQVAPLIPQELRKQILDSYDSGLGAVGALVRFDPELMQKMQRLAAVDRFLSIDGRGQELTQIEVARGYHLLGDIPSALQAAERLAVGSRDPMIQRHYSRLLRLNGEPETARGQMELFRKRCGDLRLWQQGLLVMERARIEAALNRWAECETTLDDFAKMARSADHRFRPVMTHYALMKGMLLQRRGATGPAQAVWREGYHGMRDDLRRSKGPNSEIVNAIILGSLCGELTDEECHQFFTGVVTRGGDSALVRQAQAIVGPQVTAAAMREMWRSPLGRKLAEDIAFERLTLRDRVKVPVVLIAAEYCNQSVFDREMTDEQRQAVFDVLSLGFDETIHEGKISFPQIAQIMLTWKGTANFLGWGGVAPTLSPHLRGGAAYVLAHRYLRRDDTPQAIKFLETAIADYPADSAIARLASRDLALLNAKSGRLVIASDLPEPTKLVITQGDQQVAVLDVVAGQEVDVPVGELKLSLETPRDDIRLSATSVSITPMARRHVRFQWIWKPFAAGPPLAGLISQPASNAVDGRWQIAFRHAAQAAPALAFNHDGTRVVTGADDGLLRIYDTQSQGLAAVLAPSPNTIRSVIWAPSQDLIVAGGLPWLRGWNSTTGRLLFERNDHWAGVERLSFNADGSRFASGSYAHNCLAMLWSASGAALNKWEEADYGAAEVALSPDDQWLAWLPTLPQKSHTLQIIDVESGSRREITGESGQQYSRLVFSPDSRLLAGGSGMQDIRLWRTSDWHQAAKISTTGGGIRGMMWTPDSRSLLVALGHQIIEFEASQDPPVETRRLPTTGLLRCALSPDGNVILASHSDGRLSLLNRSDGSSKFWGESRRHPLSISVRPTAHGELAVVGHDGLLRRIDRQGQQSAAAPLPEPMPIYSTAWSADGSQLAAVLADGSLAIYQPEGQWREVLPGGILQPAELAWTAAGKLAALSRSGQMQTIEPADGSILSTWQVSEGLSVALEPGDKLLTWTSAGNVELRDLAGTLKTTLTTAERPVDNVALSPAGDRLALHFPRGEVALYSIEAKQLTHLPDVHTSPAGMAWSPAGRRLATANTTGEVRIWTYDGKLQQTFTPPRPAGINALAWIDDNHLATAGDDNAVRIWNAATGQPETATLLLPGDRWACFAASGRLLASSADIESDLVYLLETSLDGLEVLRPSEFAAKVSGGQAGVQAAAPHPATPTPAPADPPSNMAEQLPTRELALIQDPAIVESSGLAASGRDDAVWTHNDDDRSPRLYLLGRTGETLARFDLQDTKQQDWEDIASFRRDDVNYLLVGDVGDNVAARTDCRLLLLKEPDLTKLPDEPAFLPVEAAISFEYEDGPHDCEALAVDVERNVALLITKELDESCGLFEVPLDHRGDKPYVARRVRELKLPLVTAMDISPDGRRLVVLGGVHAFEWSRAAKEPWTKALDRVPRRYLLPAAKQPEAIAYRGDNQALLLTSEGEKQPLWEMTLTE